jgi:hypothetical protein
MLYIGDFNAQERAITNLKVIANQERKPFWYAYPRWINRESAVVYHLNTNRRRPTLCLQLGGWLDQTCVHECERRLPISPWRSRSVLKTSRTDEAKET